MLTRILACLFTIILSIQTHAVVVYSHPPNPAGGYHKSAWFPPDGLDGDIYCFDSFILPTNTAINEVRWRGAYTNYLSNAGQAPVFDFTICIYRSGLGGFNPDLGEGGRLARYYVGGNAGEHAVGVFGGVIMYDYAFVLPNAFQATAGEKYWIQIEASQGLTPIYYWPPDWSIAAATGGNNSHFRRVVGGQYQSIGDDLAFTLYATNAPTVTINATPNPANSCTITGTGPYPINSTAALIATPNEGWGFVNWTENGSEVSNNPRYSFPTTVNRNLFANFVPAFTITTNPYPTYGGSVTGAGIYNIGSTVTLNATPNLGFVFSSWSDGNTSATRSFPATTNVSLTATFISGPNSATFTFDNAPAYTTLPVSLSANGITAQFSGYSPSGGTFAIWPFDTWGISPDGFSGLSLFPTTVFGADLIAEFSAPAAEFSMMYSPQEIGCDDSATIRATGYRNGVLVATNTATVPVPGSYPTGTITLIDPSGFDRVVVHYDARPQICQDWGPIFFADNLTVTLACPTPSIATQPVSQSTCHVGAAFFTVSTSTSDTFLYQWQWLPPSSALWRNLTEGDNAADELAAPSVAALNVSGPTLEVRPPLAAWNGTAFGDFRCVVTSPCNASSITTDPAGLTICLGDADCDSDADSDDIITFFAAWDTGDLLADADGDSDTDSDDIIAFFGAWDSGC